MPLFGENPSPMEQIVESATSEVKTTEDWGLFMDICDEVSSGGTRGAKDCVLALRKRLNHRDPHVVLHSLSLLNCLMSNCGTTLRMEVCSTAFLSELRSKVEGSNRAVSERTLELVKEWSEGECKKDPQLHLIPTLYAELKRDGFTLDAAKKQQKASGGGQKSSAAAAADAAKAEEEDLAKAIRESLREQELHKGGGRQQTTTPTSHSQAPSSLYPSAQAQQASTRRSVRALYDFEAAEDNELTFKAGELIGLIDDSDINWWKGANARGEGLFPASFVTADTAGATDSNETAEKRKSVQFDEKVEVQEVERIEEAPPPAINEETLNQCLAMLRDADPTGEEPDPPQLAALEESSVSMAPLINGELADIDRQHNLLAEVDVMVRDALALYDSAMTDASAQLQAQLQHQPPTVNAYPYNPAANINYGQPPAQMVAPQQQPYVQPPPEYYQQQPPPQPAMGYAPR